MSSTISSIAMKFVKENPLVVGNDDLALAKVEVALAQLDADVSQICCGCRCGWLCCDCFRGCIACKLRRRYCFCGWNGYFGIQETCLFCVDLRESCQCWLERRCKWCLVSLAMCKRGGCLHKLPARQSPEAQLYVDIFNMEEGPVDDEPEVVVGAEKNDEKKGEEVGDLPESPTPAPVVTDKSLPGLASPSSSIVSSVGDFSGTESPNLDEETASLGSEDDVAGAARDGSCSR